MGVIAHAPQWCIGCMSGSGEPARVVKKRVDGWGGGSPIDLTSNTKTKEHKN
jgi:hypothetical protein